MLLKSFAWTCIVWLTVILLWDDMNVNTNKISANLSAVLLTTSVHPQKFINFETGKLFILTNLQFGESVTVIDSLIHSFIHSSLFLRCYCCCYCVVRWYSIFVWMFLFLIYFSFLFWLMIYLCLLMDHLTLHFHFNSPEPLQVY